MSVLNRALKLILCLGGVGASLPAQTPPGTPPEPPEGPALVLELNRIQSLASAGAQAEAARRKASFSGVAAGEFELAALLERAGDTAGALAAYTAVEKMSGKTPIGASADFRATLLGSADRPGVQREGAMKAILAQPAAAGWFLDGAQWAWGDSRHAAWRELVNWRSSSFSFAVFQFLRANSPWKGPLAFLGILAGLTLGAKVLEMPLLVRSARAAGKVDALMPKLESIQRIYSSDPVEMNKQVMHFYKSHGISLQDGCLMWAVDMIFVVWVLLSLADFGPQMALDGSALWWISDVTKPDTAILFAWVVTSALAPLVAGQPGKKGQMLAGALISGVILGLIAYYWKWPAYVMIFWTMLNVVGAGISMILWPVRLSARSSAY